MTGDDLDTGARKGAGKKALVLAGKLTGTLVVLGGIAGLVPVVFDEGIKTALAKEISAESTQSIEQGNAVSSELIDVAQRGSLAEFVRGRFAEINIEADRAIAPANDRPETVPGGRVVPPYLELPTNRCPKNLGRQTTLRVFLYGQNVGPDNIGNPDRDTVALRGSFDLSELKSPGLKSPSTYCWIDATEK